MNKYILLSFILLAMNMSAFAQNEEVTLDANCKLKTNAKHIFYIDNRMDKNSLGYLKTGISNKLKWVVFNGKLMDSIGNFFSTNEAFNYDCEELVIIMNEFFLSEKTGGVTQIGNFRLNMRFFVANESNKFQEVLAIDEDNPVQALDVTQQLLRTINGKFCQITADLKSKINQQPLSEDIYSFAELRVIDSIEKSKIPIFNTDKAKAGIFRTFEDFKANHPDSVKLRIDDKGKYYAIVYTYGGKKLNKPKRLFVDNVYAVSNGADVFLATRNGYVKTIKKNSDYYLIRQEVANDKDHVAFWGAMFGVVGSVIASQTTKGNEKSYQFKISHLNGNVIISN